jgi:hypothetical protein
MMCNRHKGELLQTIPSLHVQKVDDGWQVSVEPHPSH